MEFKNEQTDECGFHVVKTEGFCASEQVVNKLKDLVEPSENKNLLSALKTKYRCDDEICILKNNEVKKYVGADLIEKILKENFKPIGPKCSREWLSNFNIDDIQDQMKKKYDNRKFYHIPFQMRDFEKTGSELAVFDWPSKYREGFRTFGTVMNTDYSSGKGIHWFALFGDFSDNLDVFTIEYFNSSGELPIPEVNVWMKKFKHSLNFQKPVKDVITSRIVHQKSSTECGLYSLYYIISRLHGVPWEWFGKNRVKDKVMYEFREYLFRDENK